MDIKEIIKNLKHYNNWRRDNDNEYTMPEPRQIGITIDATISELKKLLICDVVESLPNKIVIELADNELQIVSTDELEQMKKEALEFDGFESWIVKGKLAIIK